jgi:ribosomal protein S12 methylthiotransferase
MEKTARISAAKLQAKVGRTLPVIIDEVGEADEDGSIGATARSQADAPEIDGNVFLRDTQLRHPNLAPGDIIEVTIEDADEHDLYGAPADGLHMGA